jgi:hypothetical protein
MLSSTAPKRASTSRYFSGYFNSLFAKKRKLAQGELDAIFKVQSKWRTEIEQNVTDRAMAEHSIKNCYHYAGLDTPNIIWANQPINVIKILINRPDLQDVSGTIANEIWQSELKIQREIAAESILRLLAQIELQQTIELLTASRESMTIADRANDLVMSQVKDLYANFNVQKIATPLQDYRIGNLAYFDYFMRIGVDIHRVKPMLNLAKSCGWCWTFDKVAILTPKPSKISIDRQGKIDGIFYDWIDILEKKHE